MSDIPVIDLASDELPNELMKACTEHGFFYLVNHGIPTDITEGVLDQARRFFTELSDDEKQKIARRNVEEGGDGARGYQKLNENVTKGRADYHEAIDFYRPWPEEGSPLSMPTGKVPRYSFLKGPNLWPTWPLDFERSYSFYVEHCKRIGTVVVRAMGSALGVGDTFVNATQNSFWVMRAIGYPALEDVKDGGISCGEHTDYGCLTLLLMDQTRGALQIQDRGGEWKNIEHMDGALVVNIGDMMEIWTNGLWKATNHRVIHQTSDVDYGLPLPGHEGSHPLNNYRVSVPFFFEPDFDAVIEPLPNCVEKTGGEKRYETVVYGEHLTGKASTNFDENGGEDKRQEKMQ